MDTEGFARTINEANASNDISAIDDACLQWLKIQAKEYGNESKTAIDLLDIVGRLLEI